MLHKALYLCSKRGGNDNTQQRMVPYFCCLHAAPVRKIIGCTHKSGQSTPTHACIGQKPREQNEFFKKLHLATLFATHCRRFTKVSRSAPCPSCELKLLGCELCIAPLPSFRMRFASGKPLPVSLALFADIIGEDWRLALIASSWRFRNFAFNLCRVDLASFWRSTSWLVFRFSCNRRAVSGPDATYAHSDVQDVQDAKLSSLSLNWNVTR